MGFEQFAYVYCSKRATFSVNFFQRIVDCRLFSVNFDAWLRRHGIETDL